MRQTLSSNSRLTYKAFFESMPNVRKLLVLYRERMQRSGRQVDLSAIDCESEEFVTHLQSLPSVQQIRIQPYAYRFNGHSRWTVRTTLSEPWSAFER